MKNITILSAIILSLAWARPVNAAGRSQTIYSQSVSPSSCMNMCVADMYVTAWVSQDSSGSSFLMKKVRTRLHIVSCWCSSGSQETCSHEKASHFHLCGGTVGVQIQLRSH